MSRGTRAEAAAAERPKRDRKRVDYNAMENSMRVDSPKPEPKSKRGRKKGQKVREKPLYAKELARVLHHLARIRQETFMLESYAHDGFAGASREKLRPEAELQKAQKRIYESKLAIREAIKVCDEAQGDTEIPAECFDENGDIEEHKIFCAKCKGYDPAGEDNDIVMCDGMCNRAYHQKCTDPILLTEDIPEDPEGWLCPSCDAKVDIMWNINEEHETCYQISDKWDAVFREEVEMMESKTEAALKSPMGRGFLGTDLPSDDEEDDDFDPEAPEEPVGGEGAEGSGGEEGSGEEGSDSGDSDDTDDSDEEAQEGTDDEGCGEPDPPLSPAGVSPRAKRRRRAAAGGVGGEEGAEDGKMDLEEAVARRMMQEDDEGDPSLLIQTGRRRRVQVDYNALNQEMFGSLGAVAAREIDGDDDEYDPGMGSPTADTPRNGKKKTRASKKGEED